MDIEQEQIVDWAINYASYEELEGAAKALYSLYVERRKKERPLKQSEAKKYRKNYTKRYN